jgi:hypothetical protein
MDLLTRHRMPLVVLAVVFLIPIGTSSLRGLSHILTCGDEVGTPITITPAGPGMPPIVTSSVVIEEGQDPRICQALVVDFGIAQYDEDRGAVQLVVTITNESEFDWAGTIQLQIGPRLAPLPAGRIDAGESAVSRVWIHGFQDERVEVQGTLLIGP